jgi:hypothetical protein
MAAASAAYALVSNAWIWNNRTEKTTKTTISA